MVPNGSFHFLIQVYLFESDQICNADDIWLEDLYSFLGILFLCLFELVLSHLA